MGRNSGDICVIGQSGFNVIKTVFSTVIFTLLSLIILGSSTALNNMVSIRVAGLSGSYLVAVGLLLWRHITGRIQHPRDAGTELTNTAGFELSWALGTWAVFLDLPSTCLRSHM